MSHDGGAAALDVAIVGLACRFPGAPDEDAYWRNLRDGVESIARPSFETLLGAGVPESLLRDPSYVRAGGFVEDVDCFDADFFGVPPAEAEVMDPQQRLFLECGWAALESAGWAPGTFRGRTGVYAGSGLNTYLLRNVYPQRGGGGPSAQLQMLLGGDKDYLATRLAYKLGLTGPAVAVQTACSTSLVAVHLACQALLAGDCDMALAGGVSVRPHLEGYRHEEGLIFSPDGHCRAFDADAGGTAPASGLGAVVLKLLERAVADGDRVRAVIKGSAINNDGTAKVAFSAPGLAAQADVIRTAQARAGADPASISYVEAHGTGTPLGDVVELSALGDVFGAAGGCAIGSVKPNIGHADTASGVAGLIKVVLALENELLPPSLNFERPNPDAGLAGGPFEVVTRPTPWPRGGPPRRAGVSSFGIGGTNAHVVVEEGPRPAPAPSTRAAHLLKLSARTPEALEDATDRLAAHLEAHPDQELADVAFTLAVGRHDFRARRTVVASTPADAHAALAARDPRRVRTAVAAAGHRGAVLLLPALGGHYRGMGAGLYRGEPAFRAEIDRCAALAAEHVPHDVAAAIADGDPVPAAAPGNGDWDLRALTGRAERAPEEPLSLAQPALFAVEYALARLWQSWGVEPQALLGYSLGELVAACLAGVLDLEDALSVVARRALAVEALPAAGMLAIGVSEREARELCGGELHVAAVTGESSTVVAGPASAVDRLERELAERRVACRRLASTHAFHTPLVAGVARAVEEALADVRLMPPSIPFVSNVTGDWIGGAEATSPAYWARQMCEPVRLDLGLGAVWGLGSPALLEIGPGTGLGALALQHADAPRDPEPLVVGSLRHADQRADDREAIARAAGQLWLGGCHVDWEAYHRSDPARRRVPLPAYPFERRRHWLAASGQNGAASAVTVLDDHDDPERWLYLPSWRRALPAARRAEPFDRALLVARPGPVAGALAAELGAAGVETAVVDPADAVAAVSAGAPAQLVVDARCAEPDDPRPEDCDDLVALGRALAESAPGGGARMVVLCRGAHAVLPAERPVPEHAATVAVATVLAQELPGVDCRHVDLDPGAEGAAHASAIAAEVLGQEVSRVVALRGGQRFVRGVDRAGPPPPAAPEPAGTGEVWMVLGGLGALGLAVAESLLERRGARLALVSRSERPGRAAQLTDDARRRLAGLERLERAGGEVELIVADVYDDGGLETAMRAVDERFGRLDGVVVAMGEGGDVVPLDALRAGEIGDLVAQRHAFLARVERVVAREGVEVVALFSSTASILGGPGLAGYGALSSVTDAFALERSDRRARWISIGWEGWESTAAIAAAAAETSIGALFMKPGEALDSFHRVLESGVRGHVLVSRRDLDDRLASWLHGSGPTVARREDTGRASSLRAPYVAPETAVETTVAELWETILRAERVGLDDNFFALGGDSLIGARVVYALAEAFGIELSMRDLWAAPTVGDLALLVEERVIDDIATASADLQAADV
jgi:acyl transferase domain-containing protein/acyl carrier protein/NADP-dependent 3-hydroxy acid dehydrogenase YdfG